jgi:hypothetical protein
VSEGFPAFPRPYEVLARLGESGFGAVYKARHAELFQRAVRGGGSIHQEMGPRTRLNPRALEGAS